MKCLYCNGRLRLFANGKSAFCSEQHEELYHNAAQRRLETPYETSAGELESRYLQAEGEAGRVQDLAQLLKATQVDGGASVHMPAEVAIASDVLEALALAPRFVAAANASGSSESVSLTHSLPDVPPEVSSGETRADSSAPIGFPTSVGPAGSSEEMDRRNEPRVNAVQIVKVAALRDLERELSCALVNTSDSGIQFTAEQDFAIGEILVAELPGQLVLTEVRHSQAKDARYVIGAERVQTMSKEGTPSTSSGTERAELLIKALCARVGTGFADEPGQEATEAGSGQRERGLERVAKILEIWQRVKLAGQPAIPAEPAPSIGTGRTFAAVGLSLMIVALLMVCVVQYRKHQAMPAAPAAASTEIKPQPPEIKPQAVAAATPAQTTPTPAAPVEQPAAAPLPAEPQAAPTAQMTPGATGLHHARITALQSTWVGISTDGHKIFGATIPKGSTRDLEYSNIAFLHAGNAAGIEVTVDGQTVPMGAKPGLRLVELNATGFRFLRWSNDDPQEITPSSKHD